MIETILKSIYLMVPAYFANMAPVICKNIFPRLAFPLDFNKDISGKPILGKNKTFRGLIFGIGFAGVSSYIQFNLYKIDWFRGISVLDYNNWLIIGLLLGTGAMFGDIAKSFIKRRVNISPGRPWRGFDQLDFVIGAMIFISFIKVLDLSIIVTVLISSLVLNIAVNAISTYLKIRTDKW